MSVFPRWMALVGLVALASGCASHRVTEAPALSFDLEAQQQVVETSGVAMMARPVHAKSELETYFDNDLVRLGILPVQVNLHNKSYGGNLIFSPQSISLYAPDDSHVVQLGVNQIMDRAKKSYWRSAGWGVAFGLVGAGVSAVNVSQTNKKVRSTYESRIIKGGNLDEGNMTEGFVFFDVPKDLDSLDGWKLGMVLRDPNEGRNVALEYGFAGTVVARKDHGETDKFEQTADRGE